MPDVSIVLPVYNGEKYLAESIESVIAQSYKDWELIIVDDCSVDNSAEIIKEFMAKDDRIHYIKNKKNEKLPRSLNIGFSYAQGKYLTWTSDDNVYMSTAIEEMKKYLDINIECPMVVSDMCIFGSEKGEEIILQYSEDEVYLNNCVGACFLYRNIVREKIGNYDTEMFLVEDYDYWLRILFEFDIIGHINKTLYRYRLHESSLTKTRETEVKKQLNKMQVKYIDKIIAQLSGHEDLIVNLYYNMLEFEEITKTALEKIKKIVPQLKNDIVIDDERGYVIFGAGEFGRRARMYLGEKAVAYVDSNPNITGEKRNGLIVYDVKALNQLKSKNHIMIAVDNRKIYQIICQLKTMSIDDYCSWINYKRFFKESVQS